MCGSIVISNLRQQLRSSVLNARWRDLWLIEPQANTRFYHFLGIVGLILAIGNDQGWFSRPQGRLGDSCAAMMNNGSDTREDLRVGGVGQHM